MRSCDSVGVLKVHIVYDGIMRLPKLGDSSSASARRWLDIVRHNSIDHCYNFLRKDGFKIYTTHLSADSKSLYDLELTEKVALVFGNEHAGISQTALELADGNFIIPQVGMIQSLNISVACAVSLYEAFRQRNSAHYYESCRLNEEFYNAKLNEWISKSR